MRRFLTYLLLAVPAYAVLLAPRLHAATIDDFTYQEGSLTLEWQLPASPTIAPTDFSSGMFFFVSGIPFTLNGAPETSNQIFFESAASTNGGRGGFTFNFNGEGLVVATGPQVYSGPESAPTFTPNTYAVIDTPLGGPSTRGTLTIAQVVPEPSTLSLLCCGLLALGSGLALKAKRGVRLTA